MRVYEFTASRLCPKFNSRVFFSSTENSEYFTLNLDVENKSEKVSWNIRVYYYIFTNLSALLTSGRVTPQDRARFRVSNLFVTKIIVFLIDGEMFHTVNTIDYDDGQLY